MVSLIASGVHSYFYYFWSMLNYTHLVTFKIESALLKFSKKKFPTKNIGRVLKNFMGCAKYFRKKICVCAKFCPVCDYLLKSRVLHTVVRVRL